MKIVIGQDRYVTFAKPTEKAQPLVTTIKIGNHNYDIALAHNGNITNTAEIKKKIKYDYQTSIDSEVLFALLKNSKEKTIEDVLTDAFSQLEGAYCFILYFLNKETGQETMVGARDPRGWRPLVYGDNVLASETCALDRLAVKYVKDVQPGEMVILRKGRNPKWKKFADTDYRFCLFEDIYFSKLNSWVPNPQTEPPESYNTFRERTGAKLYEEIITLDPDFSVDIVVPLPLSGLPNAAGFINRAKLDDPSKFNISFAAAINPYRKKAGRTFIMHGRKQRLEAIREKLALIADALYKKIVLLIDDSIVDGYTSKGVINLLREYKPAKIYTGVGSPPIIDQCDWGVDTKRNHLIAREVLRESGYTTKQYRKNKEIQEAVIKGIEKKIGADRLFFLSINGLYECLPKHITYCDRCLTGIHPTMKK